MGRPQAFDTTEAVRAARQVFWNQGYEEAAMPALEAATGLCRSSIYHAFGNKRGLFDAAVASYLDEVVRPRLRPLLTAPVSPEAVGDYLRTLRAAIAGRTGAASADGCLLINTAASTLAGDAAVKQVIADYRAELATALRSGIDARQPELSEAGAERLAQTCTALIIAAFTIARADPQGAIAYLDLATDAVEQR
ncbi:TetR/AcrR family transcriptional regulator [Propionicimonas sp.]|uniref:TetR/AcrR family transcriptional regulator n=1 Tax=Propionicimonas sp. TaxID=1955623 RepID=UPI0017DEB916|nr:TetR/AcrR family transcriptional regulator [Propionicimonas sp.]MBU3976878.1 TetR/AcrR family transcriptional regulator [Actinomycetota bacterium]MBA3019567.1 TetR/AcrR family transcriptional regulator [Propionicimonas sp.]MBU3986973.1 TetR/AcrR family transcriptional regulator [Actinomycetota bacterium]MBU4006885.1 TetR/AcrR family transcriptional regulator [Actinomycetota bacterium]MBU4065585.1 TetR/AcrR family transcriptional regulator [Actinomycetota bacterium]